MVVAIEKDGGLRVGTLKAQKIALLTKWWWRLKNEGDCIWLKVNVSIHNLNRKPANYMGSKVLWGCVVIYPKQ